jgi:4'-phosphopantetheinyl transferase
MSEQAEILCCPTAAVDGALLAEYRALLSDDELQRLSGYRSESAASEFVIGRALLRTTLGQRLQVDAKSLVFARDTNGKPQLAHPHHRTWHFNLSHERSWVVLMLSTLGAVGVDVEGHARRNNLAAIAERFFSPEENAALAQCDEIDWRNYFFAIWTLKEAHAKARGCGLAKILSCSSITLDWSETRIDFALYEIARSDIPLTGWLYQLENDVSLAAIANATHAIAEPKLMRMVPLRSAEKLSIEVSARGNWLP